MREDLSEVILSSYFILYLVNQWIKNTQINDSK